MISMRFYVTRTDDGLIHVQNAIMGRFGQHHVHSKEDFAKWMNDGDIQKEDIIELGKTCDCGLKSGEVKEG